MQVTSWLLPLSCSMRSKASPARFPRLQDQPNWRVTGATPRCEGAGAGTAANAPCPRSRVSLPIYGRSFSPVLPRSRLAGPRPKAACSQRAPVPLSQNHVTAPSARTLHGLVDGHIGTRTTKQPTVQQVPRLAIGRGATTPTMMATSRDDTEQRQTPTSGGLRCRRRA